MPVSAVNLGAVAVDNGSKDVVADGSRFGSFVWLNMMRACEGTFDVRLERFSGTIATTTTTMTTTSTSTAMVNGDGDATTEEATSRKCEGQLSLLNAANSCSSYKPANRMTEMAQEDHGPSWNNLPSVILQEIFSYLSHETRIRASQVSKREKERKSDKESGWEGERRRKSLVYFSSHSFSVAIVCAVN